MLTSPFNSTMIRLLRDAEAAGRRRWRNRSAVPVGLPRGGSPVVDAMPATDWRPDAGVPWRQDRLSADSIDTLQRLPLAEETQGLSLRYPHQERSMADLPFSIELIRFLADIRTELLTKVFQFFTFLGEVEGYVLLITLIFVTYDKKLAYRLSVLTLVTMSLNHLLKTVIMNPRPFMTEGTYSEKWAVSPDKAEELATEYSTPSGHAMAGAAFYSYLLASVGSKTVRAGCILLILLTGLSRPYLGVHYLEDVLIGWVLGASIALLSIVYARKIARLWIDLSHSQQLTIVAASSLVLWIMTRVFSGSAAGDQPLAFVGYTGFLMGIVLAFPLEEKTSDFDPRSSPVWKKLARYALCVGLVMGTLLILDGAFEAVSSDDSVSGYLLRYIRYALAGVAGILLGPIFFVRLGLAERLPADPKAGRPTHHETESRESAQ